MFNTICGIVFLVSVVCKLNSVLKSYEKDAEDEKHWSSNNEK